MDSLAHRVAARVLADTELQVRDEGTFVLEYLPKHAPAVESIAKTVHKAMGMYQAAGIPVQHKVLVRLHGKGAAHADALYWNHQNPPMMVIAPKAYQDPILFKTVIHEFGHYFHDKVVPGGDHNPEVLHRYHWALRQKATGEGPRLDVIRKRIKVVEDQLRELADAKYILRPTPRKGQIFEFDRGINGIQLHFKGRLLENHRGFLKVEILNPEVIPFNQSGYFTKQYDGRVTITEPARSLLYQGTDPKVEAQISELERERTKLYAEAKSLTRTEQDDRYETQRSDWAPTQYSRKNSHEWFAELCTTYVLGHLKKPVEEWLLSVIKTGEAPA